MESRYEYTDWAPPIDPPVATAVIADALAAGRYQGRDLYAGQRFDWGPHAELMVIVQRSRGPRELGDGYRHTHIWIVQQVGVVEAARGRGHFSRFLAELEAEAAARGAAMMFQSVLATELRDALRRRGYAALRHDRYSFAKVPIVDE